MSFTVPFNDLHAQYLTLKDIDTAISSVIAESAFVRGSYVDRFEKEFSTLLGDRQLHILCKWY